MIDDNDPTGSDGSMRAAQAFPRTGAAERALAEAAARRAEQRRRRQPVPREIDGRQGPEPVRYGDWENKGIASDF